MKTRISNKYGIPIDSVNVNKQKHIKNSAKYYIYLKNLHYNKIRFDVIEIYVKKNIYLNHLKNLMW